MKKLTTLGIIALIYTGIMLIAEYCNASWAWWPFWN